MVSVLCFGGSGLAVLVLGDLAGGKAVTASKSSFSGWLFYIVGEEALQDLNVEEGFVKRF